MKKTNRFEKALMGDSAPLTLFKLFGRLLDAMPFRELQAETVIYVSDYIDDGDKVILIMDNGMSPGRIKKELFKGVNQWYTLPPGTLEK